VAAPVATVIGLFPVARAGPPKSPLPVSVRVTVAFPPAGRLARIPQTFTHFTFPEAHRPRIRDCPVVGPLSPSTYVLFIPAESAIGTPKQNGSLERETPDDPPGYNASWIVSGMLIAAPRGVPIARRPRMGKTLFISVLIPASSAELRFPL